MTQFESTRQSFFYRGNAVAYGFNFTDASLSASIPVTGGRLGHERGEVALPNGHINGAGINISGHRESKDGHTVYHTKVETRLEEMALQFGPDDADVFRIIKLRSNVVSDHDDKRRHPLQHRVRPEDLSVVLGFGETRIHVAFDKELCLMSTAASMEERYRKDDKWRGSYQRRFLGEPPAGFRFWFTRPGLPLWRGHYVYHLVSKIEIEGKPCRHIEVVDNKLFVDGFGQITLGGVIRDESMLRLSLVRFNMTASALRGWWELNRTKAAEAAQAQKFALSSGDTPPPPGDGGTAGEVESNGMEIKD